MSIKVAEVVPDENTVIALDVVPANDAPLLAPLLDETLERVPDVQEIVGDKGFDGDRLREECLKREVNPNIPLKSNRDLEAWTMDAGGVPGAESGGTVLLPGKTVSPSGHAVREVENAIPIPTSPSSAKNSCLLLLRLQIVIKTMGDLFTGIDNEICL